MLKIKKVSEVLGKQAFTDAGDFLGEVEEANLAENKVDGWRIRVASHMAHMIGGARGIIVPHQFVKSIGDVFIVSKASLPMREETEIEEVSVSDNE
jgi:sporulation protein YlmC with PRC-barrel domain